MSLIRNLFASKSHLQIDEGEHGEAVDTGVARLHPETLTGTSVDGLLSPAGVLICNTETPTLIRDALAAGCSTVSFSLGREQNCVNWCIYSSQL
jgi:hypothetical protein